MQFISRTRDVHGEASIQSKPFAEKIDFQIEIFTQGAEIDTVL